MSENDSPQGVRPAFEALKRDLNRQAGAKRGGGVWRWLVRLALAGFVVGIILPVLWVLLYRVVEAPGTLLMAKRDGQGETIARDTVRLKQISPHLVRAVIAAEDARFCAHDGFDMEAIQKALKANKKASNKKRGRLRGGSTISQQTAKNLFLWPERSWVRKGLEAYFTVLIEGLWPKARIMEAYLNAAEWGEGRFGAEAAAQALFGKSAKDLSPREAARMAAILPSPNKWRADQPGPYVRRRAATIESRMAVVRRERLDACVLAPGAPAPKAKDGPKAAPPKLEPLPVPPVAEAPPELSVADVASAAELGAAPGEEAEDAAIVLEGDPAPAEETAAPEPAAELDETPTPAPEVPAPLDLAPREP